MVKIRLARHGAKKRPFYRVVAADERSKRDGAYIELLGTYDPNRNPGEVQLDLGRIDYWLSKGAQPTQTAGNLIQSARRAAESAQ